ncbi:calmodulin-beta [Eurytemora carolleeae]|uniref:calmodulin-beta n=1 Tax=Eurytemora carolleeae TaxID=1294199 RepID=UPI000C788197|nr:calmodulin-beta [Eurytemora carolleeae]|eukprot:XP_023338087.1 calmodulin-beta-like [Eurytemora affinis]
MSWRKVAEEPKLVELSDREMEVVTTVFRSYETGLREATIYPKDLLAAMKMLGLNPMEQEIIDLTNEIARNGFIYFPEFCNIITRKFREEDEEVFRQNMFKMLCGTEPFPELFRAKKYKINDNFILKKDFRHMMLNLPVPVSEQDIEDMFNYADSDRDGRINYKEFQTMINPPKPPEPPKPSIKDYTAVQMAVHTPNTQQQQIPLPQQQQTLSVSNMMATAGNGVGSGYSLSNT